MGKRGNTHLQGSISYSDLADRVASPMVARLGVYGSQLIHERMAQICVTKGL